MINSAVILEKYGEQFFSKGFSTDNGRYRSQLTTKKSQEKSLVIFAQTVQQVAHTYTGSKISFSYLIIELKISINTFI